MTYRNRFYQPHTESAATYQKTTLANGIRVITEEIRAVKSASVGIWINTGSRNETPENNGISHFIEHMVFKGTKKRSIQQIARSIESVGGFMNAFTTKEHTCFYARVLDEYVENAIDVLSDIVQNSLFPVKEIEKEKTVVIEEIKTVEDDPDDLVQDYFEKHLFGKHPLAMQIIGTEENVSSFTRKQLNEYIQQHYTNNNIIVTVAGNVKHEIIVQMVERYFTKSARKEKFLPNEKISKPKKSHNDYVKPIQQSHLCTGTVAFGIRSELRYPGLILNTLLGDGMSSRLFQQIRERHGLAYNVYSFLTLMNDTGIFGIYIGTDKNQINKALDLSYEELQKLKSKQIQKSELQRTKAQLKGNMLLSLESTSNRMMRLGSGELYFGEYTPLDSIVKNIDAVTTDDVQKVAQLLFREELFTTVVLSPLKTN